jgi:hypothetical protein
MRSTRSAAGYRSKRLVRVSRVEYNQIGTRAAAAAVDAHQMSPP